MCERTRDSGFLDEVHCIPGGEKIEDCFQSGTCAGSCPVSWAMEVPSNRTYKMDFSLPIVFTQLMEPGFALRSHDLELRRCIVPVNDVITSFAEEIQ